MVIHIFISIQAYLDSKIHGANIQAYLDSKIHGANMGPIWGRQDPGGPHVGPMDFVIWVMSNSMRSMMVVILFDPLKVKKGKLIFIESL